MAHNIEDEPTHSESEEEGVTPMAPVRGPVLRPLCITKT